MTRITNEVLLEKITNIHDDIKEIKYEVKSNTEFRLQFKGAIATIITISTVLGSGISFIISKFMR